MDRKPKEDTGYAKHVLNDSNLRFVDDPSKEGTGYITSYDIDSAEGLKLFADTIKKYNLY